MKQHICYLWFVTGMFSLLHAEAPLLFIAQKNSTNVIAADITTGFALADAATTCSLAARSVSGPLSLNGGTIALANNTELVRDASFASAGVLDGKGYVMQSPYQSGVWMLPHSTAYSDTAVEEVSAYSLRNEVESESTVPLTGLAGIDIVGCDGVSYAAMTDQKNGMFNIYRMFGTMLFKEALIPLQEGRLVQWNPIALCGVVAVEYAIDGSKLCLYHYDRSTKSISTRMIGAHRGDITALSWSAQGDRLAIAEYDESARVGTKSSMSVYRMVGNDLELIDRIYYSDDITTRLYSCAWRPDGRALLAGRGKSVTDPQVMVYSVTATAVTLSSAFQTSSHVSTISFQPKTNRCLIGLVAATGSSRLLSCVVNDDVSGKPVHQLPTQYQVSDDVYEISWHKDGTIVAIETYKGTMDDGSGVVTIYRVKGDNVDDMSAYPHGTVSKQMVWAPHEQHLMILDEHHMLMQLSLMDGMRYRNISLIGHAPIHLKGSVGIEGNVLFDGQKYPWEQDAEAFVHLAPSAQLTWRNCTIRNTLSLCGGRQSFCSFEECSFQTGLVRSGVPLFLSGKNSMQGVFKSHLVARSGATIVLEGPLTLNGSFEAIGNVLLDASGHDVTLDNPVIALASGAQFSIRNATMINFPDGVRAASTSTLRLTDCVVQLQAAGGYAQGAVQCKNVTFITQDGSYRVVEGTFFGESDTSLLNFARSKGIQVNTVASQNEESVSAVPFLQPIHIHTNEYVLQSSLYLSAQNYLQINADTVIRGNQFAIRSARSSDAIIRIAPGKTVTLTDVNLADISPESIVGGENSMVIFGSGTTVLLGGSGSLALSWYLQKGAVVDGNFHKIAVSDAGSMIVMANDEGVLQRVRFEGVEKDYIRAEQNALIWLENVTFMLQGDYEMALGSWRMKGDVLWSGPFEVDYASTKPFFVTPGASVRFCDGITFTYNPVDGRVDGIQCDESATIIIENSAFQSMVPSCRITDGRVILKGSVTLVQDAEGQLYLGDHAQERYVTIVPEAGTYIHIIGDVSISPAF